MHKQRQSNNNSEVTNSLKSDDITFRKFNNRYVAQHAQIASSRLRAFKTV